MEQFDRRTNSKARGEQQIAEIVKLWSARTRGRAGGYKSQLADGSTGNSFKF